MTGRTQGALPVSEILEQRVLMSGESGRFDGSAPLGADASKPAGLSAPLRATRGLGAAATVLTAADRLELLSHWRGPIATSLKYRLRANDLAGFDQMLLSYMVKRTNARFFFTPGELPADTQLILNDPGTPGLGIPSLSAQASSMVAKADAILAHRFPEQVSSDTYTVQLGTKINWLDSSPSGNPSFVHALNRHGYWQDLAMAYRFTWDARYAGELIAQLNSWSAQNPPQAKADDWQTNQPRWFLLDTAARVDHWMWSYFLLLGTRAWSPAANTLFLHRLWQHGDFLYNATPQSLTSNKATAHGTALSALAMVFPEFTDAAAWEYKGKDVMLKCLDRQFRPDGFHFEQSPAYHATAMNGFVEDVVLSRLNGRSTWTSSRLRRLRSVIEAHYQMLNLDGRMQALSDTYSSNGTPPLTRASLALGDPAGRWLMNPPRVADVFMFGAAAVQPALGVTYENYQTPFDRGSHYALPDSGYYTVRGQESPRTRVDPDGVEREHLFAGDQFTFDAGPKGGTHRRGRGRCS